MKKLLASFFLLSSILFAQNLFMPWNIKQAYEGNTRDYSGQPGKDYWQNSSDYFISAELDPSTSLLKGREEILYHNNSPKALKKLVIRLYQNYYKKGAPRDYSISPEAVNDGMVLHSLSINGEEISLKDNPDLLINGTNLFLKLTGDISAGSTINLEIEWSFQIPKKSKIRMGQYDSTSFYVAYWYPQIAVYDDIDGWDTFDYGGTTEFYNDFNNYTVEITVPEGFLVWAAGLNTNIDELLKPEFYERWKKARTSEEVVHIVTEDDYKNGSPTIEDDYNTWSFVAENIPDFTFGTSDHYLWDMTSLVVDSLTGRRTVVDAVYKKESKDFYEVADIAKKSIHFLSYEMPAVPYPYPKLTVFNGSGGMEAPMMVNDGSTFTRANTVGVTSHEIAHTYFPFYMGINERKYAWMDEGWASMLPIEFQKREGSKHDPLVTKIHSFSLVSGDELELPMMIPSVLMKGRTYRDASYTRLALAYYFLYDFLGKEKFLKALHLYIERWNGKHPLPYDFFFSFNQAVGENLYWFWQPWFFERCYPDIAVKNVKENGDEFTIFVEKIGSLPVPAALTVTFFDGSTEELYKPADVWKNSNSYSFKLKSKKRIKKVNVNLNRTPDRNNNNNEWVLE